ncbi:MAG: hypothetical protein DHS20C20_30230 [Ardenticatenaceae bacterium]|nr:MAG: hypothetical protein DHS20C20_30230 [Ardenticatenaceae bacterium]
MRRYKNAGWGKENKNGDAQLRNFWVTSVVVPSPSALLFNCGETNHAASMVHYPFSANLAEL